jgi:hypothetical protein
MSRYDWSKAPSWVKYIATDKCGDIWGHEKEPFADGGEWLSAGRYEKLFTNEHWLESLEERPSE